VHIEFLTWGTIVLVFIAHVFVWGPPAGKKAIRGLRKAGEKIGDRILNAVRDFRPSIVSIQTDED
jgi:hypothetical protein